MRIIIKRLVLVSIAVVGILALILVVIVGMFTGPAVYKIWQLRNADSIVVHQESATGWAVVEKISDRRIIREIVDDLVADDLPGDGNETPSSACPFKLKLEFIGAGWSKSMAFGVDDCCRYHSADLRVEGGFRAIDGHHLQEYVERARHSWIGKGER
jgi:hypothetical protein